MGKKGKTRAKRREKKKPDFPDIPEEIVADIRTRLPVKSLSRFTCVSKQWHSSISDIFAQRIGGKMALVESALASGTLTFHSLDTESHVERVCRPWNKKSSSWSKNPTIMGSCNGLLLMGVHDDLFLWNPLTKYFKKVLSYAPLGEDGFHIASGLCHDSSTKEYKAVMVFSHENQYSSGHFAVVGSFRSSSWRRVCFPYHFCHKVKSGPIVNKHLHWHIDDPFRPKILYFDIQMNEFIKVPMPESHTIEHSRYWILNLGVLDGCLCMVHCENSTNRNVDVLAMKEFGIRDSWTTMFIVSDSWTTNFVPFGYTKCGEVLMKVTIGDRGCEIITYNHRACEIMDCSHRKISIQDDCDYVNAVMYEETLVTPTDYDWEERELRGEATYVEYFLQHRPPQKVRKRSDGTYRERKIGNSFGGSLLLDITESLRLL